MTMPSIIKALQLQLCKMHCETMISTEQRYIEKTGFIATKYKVIYWLTPKDSSDRKQKIEKEFSKQSDVIQELNAKVKEWKANKESN